MPVTETSTSVDPTSVPTSTEASTPTTAATDTSPAFVAELSDRVRRTRATIDSAAAAGDDDLAQALLDDLEGLVELASAHDVALPDTVEYLARNQHGVIDLTATHLTTPAACAPA